MPPDTALLAALGDLVSQAAEAVMAVYATDFGHRTKDDASPVTEADERAEAIIVAGLDRLLPGVPVIAEEAVSRGPLPDTFGDTLVFVDPVDGTREFLSRNGEFTINVALVTGGHPVLGLVAAPARGLCWAGLAGHGASRVALAPGARFAGAPATPIAPRKAPAAGLVLAASRSHPDAATAAWAARMPVVGEHVVGSALKFCDLAEGRADVYPRLVPLAGWDVAAGHAVLAAAGGAVVAPDFGPLPYGRRATQFRLDGFLAVGDPALLDTLPRP